LIHGEDAVFDIEPSGTVERSNRDERARLAMRYAKRDGANPVSTIYPGAASRVFQTLDEIGLPEHLFKTETRVSPTSGAPARGSRKKDPAPPAGQNASEDAAGGQVFA